LKVLAMKPEETLAIICNAKLPDNAKLTPSASDESDESDDSKPEPEPEATTTKPVVATGPEADDDSASDFAGAGPPPRPERVDVGENGDDLWRYGFPTAR